MTTEFNPGATLSETLHPIDIGALRAYMHAHVGSFDGDPVVEQFQGGQSNPTYKVTAGKRRYVLLPVLTKAELSAARAR